MTRPARNACTCAVPCCDVLKRSVTAKPVLLRSTIGRPVDLSVPLGPVGGGPAPLKVALTAFAAFIVTVHVVVTPEQAPPQPPNVAPEAGVAVSVMLDPVATFALQVAASPPQSIPPPVTLPLPLTDTASGTVEPVP